MISFVFLYCLSVNSVQIFAKPCVPCPDQYAPMLAYPVSCVCGSPPQSQPPPPPPPQPEQQSQAIQLIPVQYVVPVQPVMPAEQVTVTVSTVEKRRDPVEDMVRDSLSKMTIMARNQADFVSEENHYLEQFTNTNIL